MLARHHPASTGYPSVLDFAFRSAAIKTSSGEGRDRARLARVLRAGPALCRRRWRRRGSFRPSSAITTWAASLDFVRKANSERGRRGGAEAGRRSAMRMMLPRARRADRSIMATSRDSSATAATRTRARTCSRARSPSTTTTTWSASNATTAQSNFDPITRSTRLIASWLAIRAGQARRCAGGEQVVRAYGGRPGLFALSRRSSGGGEILVAVQHVDRADRSTTSPSSRARSASRLLLGDCPATASAPGSVPDRRLPPLGYAVCRRLGEQTARNDERVATAAMVARRRHLPDLSAQLRGFERRRHRRPARDHAAARSCRLAGCRRHLALALLHLADEAISATTSPTIAASIRSSGRSSRFRRARRAGACARP